ncbi:3'(2'),5'-bisphosphate nucleotidase CysQ [Thiomicrospira cyclica]|uniref:3'(2'),5'-bisphosphate nucleotidase CysQ n=1 Tax=Thiomicrospira cyclica (strain DSM 14477 / JCM 11371 / ALM1) TaxID=717773 RepID=F6DB97_THICA|nr:3'(2'),5'-bisphosphate nucleotidase CysQ [Thiomicrospira cyclica]AEG31205.1 3'(2'),5'-bisphosphate nucleotidase [Thiomicrospira cyclica ALM1]
MNLSQQDYQAWLPEVCHLARYAGTVIMDIYQCPDCHVEQKQDGSPVTAADRMADQLIREGLAKLTPHIPVVSEENLANTPYEQRQCWSCFWLVDPLDGTKEFVERTDEFCVNIALVLDGVARLGVIFAPVTNQMFSAYEGGEATLAQDGRLQRLTTRVPAKAPIKVTASRRHGRRLDRVLETLTPAGVDYLPMGSALKSCLVASGQADIYPRFGPTSHWDTAASQVIVEAAGGALLDMSLQPLRYFPTEDLLNPHFVVIGDIAWLQEREGLLDS